MTKPDNNTFTALITSNTPLSAKDDLFYEWKVTMLGGTDKWIRGCGIVKNRLCKCEEIILSSPSVAGNLFCHSP